MARRKRRRKRRSARRHSERHASVPKVCGGDVELGNAILGLTRRGGTCYEASRALLREISGTDGGQAGCNWGGRRFVYGQDESLDSGLQPLGNQTQYGGSSYADGGGYFCGYNSQDWGRKFLASNGGCVYIDMNHLELCLPELRSAYDHVACWHAMLRVARDAMGRANDRLPQGQRLQVLVNNSDGMGNSYGSHMNFMVTRRCWDDMFHHKLHHMLYLASYLTSSIVFTGAGKVGSENGREPVPYQIAQRADFFETLTSLQTTHHRPIVNSRDESLCGRSSGLGGDDSLDGRLARMHVIFFDNTLSHVASLLKIGATQIILAMIEQEYLTPLLILDSPLEALIAWSHDPDLRARARLATGRRYTAVEMQLAILDHARRFVAAGRADGIVPRAEDILAKWEETIGQLEHRDTESLMGKLDWVLKRCLLERAMGRNGLTWESPEMKHLDHLYSSLDSAEGLYWACQQGGVVQRVVSDEQIERFVHQPPEGTRAWGRAHILRRVDPDSISRVDWDSIELRYRRKSASRWPSYTYRTLHMTNPLGFTRSLCERAMHKADSTQKIVQTLEPETTSPGTGGRRAVNADRPAASGNAVAAERPHALPYKAESDAV